MNGLVTGLISRIVQIVKCGINNPIHLVECFIYFEEKKKRMNKPIQLYFLFDLNLCSSCWVLHFTSISFLWNVNHLGKSTGHTTSLTTRYENVSRGGKAEKHKTTNNCQLVIHCTHEQAIYKSSLISQFRSTFKSFCWNIYLKIEQFEAELHSCVWEEEKNVKNIR